MSMTARDMVEQLNAIKASVKSGETPALAEGLAKLQKRIKETFDPEILKAMIQEDADVDTGIEEELTTLKMEWMRQRGTRP